MTSVLRTVGEGQSISRYVSDLELNPQFQTIGAMGGFAIFNANTFRRFSILLDKVIFFCLLGVIVLAVLPYGTVDAWWEAVFECAVFALTALWLVEGLLSGTWQLRRLLVLLPVLLIALYAFFQTVKWPISWPLAIGHGPPQTLTIDRYQTYLTARKTLALSLFLGLLMVHLANPRRLRWLVRVLVALGVASAVFGILRQLVQSPDSTTGFGLPFLFYGLGYGEFISPNAFAYLMEMTYGLLMGLALGGGVRGNRVIIYFAGIIVVWAALVLCNSRGGIVSFTCQSILLLFISLNWYSERRRLKEDAVGHKFFAFVRTSPIVRAAAILLVVGTLTVGVLWMGGEQLASKLERSATTQTGLDGTTRKEIWHSTWQLVKQHPWTGVGFGAYFLAIPQYQSGSGLVKLEQAHNDYLDLAANGGLIAVGLAGWFVAAVIWRAKTSLGSRDSYRRAVALGATAGTLGVAIHSFVDFALQLTGLAVVLAALLVILISGRQVESVTQKIR